MANVLDRNFDFATNGTVTAAGLHNLIDETNIYAGLISTQEERTSVGTGDLLLIANSSSIASPQIAANRTTVYNLFEDALTGGTYVNAQLSGNLTYGTATGNRTISTGANITNGTISTLIAGTTTSTAAAITNGTITTALIPTLTAGTTTGTAGIFTSGTVATLNSTTGTIGNLSTTLAGDFTISQGTGTLGTTGATLGTYGGATSVPVLAINAKGQVTSTGTAAITSGLTGFRNRIINGDMRIDQRNAGSAYAVTTGAAYGSCDRWGSLAGATGVWSQQRVTTGSTDFPFATRVQRTAGSTSTAIGYIGQVIETANCQDMAGQQITLSFYATAGANFSASGSFVSCEVFTGTGSDQGWATLNTGSWTGSTLALNLVQAITTTRTMYSSTFSIASGVNEIAVRFSAAGTGTAGANDWFQITGVQLEAGSTATDFERRPIGTELALCQRYFYVLSVAPFARFENSTLMGFGYNTMNVMRASPTLSMQGTITIRNFTQGGPRTATSPSATFQRSNPSGGVIELNASSWSLSNSSGDISCLMCDNDSNGIALSSEL
jgi:hypothetical protein